MIEKIESGTSTLLCELRDRVAVITLNRPDALNALSDDMTPALRRIVRACGEDHRVGALLITGAGRAFCAGGDVKGMGPKLRSAGMSMTERVADLQLKQRTLTGALRAVRKPTVAALPGATVGAGLAIALSCDLRIAAESAFITTGYARVALSGDYGINWLLTRTVGSARARELLYLGQRVTALRCEVIGLVNQVVPDDKLQQAAFETARALAQGPMQAFHSMKDNLDEAMDIDFLTSLDREAERLLHCSTTPEHIEALQALMEKRPPVFQV